MKPNVTGPEDGPQSPAGVPSITIAGEAWPIPQLSPRQNRIVVPALLEVLPKIMRARAQSLNSEEGGSLAQLARYLDTTTYDQLSDIVFHALTRAHTDLKRETFDDMPVDTAELFAAIGVIALQAGLLKPERATARASL